MVLIGDTIIPKLRKRFGSPRNLKVSSLFSFIGREDGPDELKPENATMAKIFRTLGSKEPEALYQIAM
jgi:hypothetical protein